ncbi:MAG: Nif3-like dinuclear metal center hexameric protein [Lentisphaeria bacterium]|nr:Nif3-like dinuclear metal center hexameric protein [Lentisphaeria bacterium]
MMSLTELVRTLDERLPAPAGLHDPSNNGLQVEGTPQVERVAFGVDASIALFREAAAWGAHVIMVHHGLSWGTGFTRILGPDAQRLKILLENNISLYASHIPLDCNPRLGNNAVILRRLGLKPDVPFGAYAGVPIGFQAPLPRPMTLKHLAQIVNKALETSCRVLTARENPTLRTVAVVSGGGADMVSQCRDAGIDCLITGEIAHQNVHPAWEAGIPILAAGHYTTETWGLKTVLQELEQTLPLACRFIDLPTGY